MSSFRKEQRKQALKQLIKISREYGSDTDFVIAGGGNTSVKVADELWVKASGTELGIATESTFVAMDRSDLDAVLTAMYPDDSREREALVKRALLRTMLRPDQAGRPSVEASLHNLLPYRFVVHTHPWKVNALTCSRDGMKILRDRYAGRAIAVPYTDPGYNLAIRVESEIGRFGDSAYETPQIIFLGNHGLIVGAETLAEIRRITAQVVSECERELERLPRSGAAGASRDAVDLVNVIRSTLSVDGRKTTALLRNRLTDEFCASPGAFKAIALPFTPDQIVFCRSHPLFVPSASGAGGKGASATVAGYLRALAGYRTKHGMDPTVICAQGVGLVTVADSARNASLARDIFHDVMKIAYASRKSGGPKPMSTRARQFIESWEVEKYRRAISAGSNKVGGARTAVVTGGAQGFGEGIVRSLHADGFNVVIADLNAERGRALAAELNRVGSAASGGGEIPPPNGARFVKTNVTDEGSVENLLADTVLEFGGCDVLVSNAGVLRAGGLEEIDSKTFDFMTSVNYKGYFICAKYASVVMKRQNEHAPHLYSDIIQINSKSGLEGSNRNFTYAGGKFGGLGLTQSFALELMPHRIKVNSICPGNFLDGPLWSDPKQGLFVQYLKTGKVPGAKSIEDVRKAYEAKVPASRGCTVGDVMRAVNYVIEQEYETGQAVPVTGGQIMLK